MTIRVSLIRIAIVVAMASPGLTAWAQAPGKVSNGTLTDSRGMTLYTNDRDIAFSGKSVCSGSCAENWPPFAAKETDKDQGNYTAITRDDGKKQWAYNGKPLYLWAKDKKPGDKTGEGVGKVWHAASP